MLSSSHMPCYPRSATRSRRYGLVIVAQVFRPQKHRKTPVIRQCCSKSSESRVPSSCKPKSQVESPIIGQCRAKFSNKNCEKLHQEAEAAEESSEQRPRCPSRREFHKLCAAWQRNPNGSGLHSACSLIATQKLPGIQFL